MIMPRTRILIKITFLKHFALEVWVSIFEMYLSGVGWLNECLWSYKTIVKTMQGAAINLESWHYSRFFFQIRFYMLYALSPYNNNNNNNNNLNKIKQITKTINNNNKTLALK